MSKEVRPLSPKLAAKEQKYSDLFNFLKPLHDAGFAILWTQGGLNAKVPSGKWKGLKARRSWETLVETYKPRFGVGVALGEASKLKAGGYLAMIDVDLKSEDPAHKAELKAAVKEQLPGLLKKRAKIVTGYGSRYLLVTDKPIAKKSNLGRSKELTKVLKPSDEVTDETRKSWVDAGLLTGKEIDKGWRIRPAWEIDLMSNGTFGVLPPTIHPDTKKPYRYRVDLEPEDLLTSIPRASHAYLSQKFGAKEGRIKEGVSTTAPKLKDLPDVDLKKSGLSVKLRRALSEDLASGEKHTRHGRLYGLCMRMLEEGLSAEEVTAVCCDPAYGIAGYVAEKTRTPEGKPCQAWVDWVHEYTADNAAVEHKATTRSAESVFSALEGGGGDEDPKKSNWKRDLDRKPLTTEQREKGMKEGTLRATSKNVKLILMNEVSKRLVKRNLFRQVDTFSCDVPWAKDKAGNEVSEDDVINIKFWLAENWEIEPRKDYISDALTEIALLNAFHPIRERIQNLPAWDGTPRLARWLIDHFGAEGPVDYIGEAFTVFMVASIKRIFEPGTKFDWMLVLEGPQGAGKTAFGDILFGEDVFLSGIPNLDDKDAALSLQGNMCIEFGELAALHKSKLENVKSFITRRVDKVRPPYGRRWVEIPRQCVFLGTTDKEKYLRDDAGNRRFVPINVGHLDFNKLEEDREQILAEAYFLYANELVDKLVLSNEAKAHLAEIHQGKMVEDASEFMVNEIEKFLDTGASNIPKDKFDLAQFRIVDLWSPGWGPLQNFQQNELNLRLAGKALKKIGCIKKHTRIGNTWSFTPIKSQISTL